jgi:hypothetical protein
MKDPNAKLIQYIQSGFHIKSCTRSRSKRVLQLEAPVLSFYRPSLKLTDAQYQTAMRGLIAWLVDRHLGGDIVEVCTSHYGTEWVELRNRHGRVKSRMALSVRTIDSLKNALMDATARQAEQAFADGIVGTAEDNHSPDPRNPSSTAGNAEFPRVLPRQPAIRSQDLPEQWRPKQDPGKNHG